MLTKADAKRRAACQELTGALAVAWEGAGGATLKTRCRSDLASEAPHYESLGRCISNGGQRLES